VQAVVRVITPIAEIVSWVPGPVGAIASGIAAAGYAVQGNWAAAASSAFGAITGGAGGKIMKAVKAVKRFGGKIDHVKQAGHIKGTADYLNRIKTGKRRFRPSSSVGSGRTSTPGSAQHSASPRGDAEYPETPAAVSCRPQFVG
jgi:hypothetical protein